MKTEEIDKFFVPTYKRSGAPLDYGKGSYLFDTEGKKYLDFGCGIAVNSLGHGNKRIIKVLVDQAKKLIHSSNLYYSEPQIELAKLLVKLSFGDRVFFCNSGTEANEAAIKFARKWAKKISQEKYHILSFEDGFHGRTYGALSATAQKKFHVGFEPLVDGFHYAPFNNREYVKELFGKYDFAAIIVEPLQCEGGVNSADRDFLKFLREVADNYKCALIFDEIQCGMGRCGTLWCYEQYNVEPDIMTLAKPIGGGLPLGAVVVKEDIALSIGVGEHGTTFGGNTVACAVGLEVLKTVSNKKFLKEVRDKGEYLVKGLKSIQKEISSIIDIRGLGLLVGVRLDRDPVPIIEECKKEGLLLIKANHNTIRFIPPLNVNKREIDKALSIFKKVMKKSIQ
ncbi:MAG: aspartate aminotransferase family protein [Chitinispirillaceae bacterium]|nr:aspartate aminotransferase family protein [Chitinispirillaceae bacterium]